MNRRYFLPLRGWMLYQAGMDPVLKDLFSRMLVSAESLPQAHPLVGSAEHVFRPLTPAQGGEIVAGLRAVYHAHGVTGGAGMQVYRRSDGLDRAILHFDPAQAALVARALSALATLRA